jgi:hypothetical protein
MSGEELAKLEEIDREKVLPGVTDLIDPDAVEAVREFTSQ